MLFRSVLFPDRTAAERRARVLELLSQVRLDPALVGRHPHQLSGGQKQRVAIARAFAAEPRLLLCDEIVSALDVSVQASILELIADLTLDTETAVLFVTHDLAVVRAIAERVYVMRGGAILETGPKPNRIVISTGGDRRVIDMAPGSQQTVELAMPHGMPYKYDPRFPTNYVYMVTIASSTGFVPMFENGAPDSRFLGVMVRLIPTYGDPQ